MMSVASEWKASFFETVKSDELAAALRDASLEGKLKNWTTALTKAVVQTCERNNWLAAAKGHELDLLPKTGSEYLGIDVTAFEPSDSRWPFPVAVIELENSRDDERIAYSLWKVLNVRAKLRIVFCYRAAPEDAPSLIEHLNENVVASLSIDDRVKLGGNTLVVIGYRDNAGTLPYGFFK